MKKLIIALFLPLFISGCGEKPSKSNEINLYSQRHYEVDKLQYKKFEESTGIKVNVIKANADELIERMTQYNELGYKKLIDPKYQLPDIPRIVKEVIDDYDAGNVPSALTGKSQSPPIQVPQVKSISPKQQSLDKLKELREELRDNKKKYNKDEIAQMEADIKKLADELEGKQKNIFDKTGL